MMLNLYGCQQRSGPPAPVSYGYGHVDSTPDAILSRRHQPKTQVYHIKSHDTFVPSESQKIVVQQGDTVKTLSKKYNISAQEIITQNNLTSPFYLFPGQNLNIPKSSHAINTLEDISETVLSLRNEHILSKSENTEIKLVKNDSPSSYLVDDLSSMPPKDFTDENLEYPTDKVPSRPNLTSPSLISSNLSLAEREKKLEEKFSLVDDSDSQNSKKSLSKVNQESDKKTQKKSMRSEIKEDESVPKQDLQNQANDVDQNSHFKSPKTKTNDALTKNKVEDDTTDRSLSKDKINPQDTTQTTEDEKKSSVDTSINSTSQDQKFTWPVKGNIVSEFGQGEGKMKNDGINISAPQGTPIAAVQSGAVVYAGNEMQGFGNLVLIKHPGGWISSYGHCAKILVRQGQKVLKGDRIGLVGNTGSVKHPQLHFELRKKSKVVDPQQYLE